MTALTIDSFRQYLLTTVPRVFEVATQSQQELEPVCFLLTDDGVAAMSVARFMRSGEDKEDLMLALSALARVPAVYGIALVNEVWMAEVSKQEVTANGPFIPPEQRVDRREGAMIRIEFRGHPAEVWTAPIETGNDGRTLGAFEAVPVQGGRMAESLFSDGGLPN